MIRNQDRDDMMRYILNSRLSESTWRFIFERVTSDISPSTRGNISWQAQLAETFIENGNGVHRPFVYNGPRITH